MPIPNEKLVATLWHVIREFACRSKYDDLFQWGNEVINEYSKEDPGTAGFWQAHLQVPERTENEKGPYVFAAVDISDDRTGFGKGSAYLPICGSLYVYQTGAYEAFIDGK
jgi:hypothetical protein